MAKKKRARNNRQMFSEFFIAEEEVRMDKIINLKPKKGGSNTSTLHFLLKVGA